MANKETRIFQENTFEEFRQLTNEVSLHLGDNELLNNLLTDKTFNYTASSNQDIFTGNDNNSKSSIFELSPQRFVDSTGGYIILTGSPSITGFTASATLYQGTLGSESFTATIISADTDKILLQSTSGSFNPAANIKVGVSNSIAAANIVRLSVESYPYGIVRVYKNGTELEQSMGINGFHVANHSSNINVQNVSVAERDEFVEGTVIYQGATQTTLEGVQNNATWFGTVFSLDGNVLRVKSESGTFNTGTPLKNLDGVETIIAGDILSYSALDTSRGNTIVLNTPASVSDSVKVFSMDLVAAVNELQVDLGQIENLNASFTATDLVSALNEHEIDLYGNPVGSLTSLGTNDKTSFVSSINELETAIRGISGALVGDAGNTGGLTTAASDLLGALREHEAEIFGAEGASKRTLSDMGTTNVDSLVDAIAELETAIRGTDNNLVTTILNNGRVTGGTATDLAGMLVEHEADLGDMIFTGLSATNVSSAVRELRTELGNHLSLGTDLNTNIVTAINELETAIRGTSGPGYSLVQSSTNIIAALDEHEGDIGNMALTGLTATDLSAAARELRTELGDVTTLGTTVTSNTVGAINELETAIRGIGTNYTLGTDSNNLVGGVNELETFARGANANYTLNTGSANVRDAINELEADLFNAEGAEKRTLASLGTTDKTSIVDAINELETAVRGTGTNYALNTGANNLVGAINEHEGDIGDMSLTGLTATNLSAAARELRTELGDVTTLDDATGYTKTVASEAIVEIQGKIGNVTAVNMGTTASTVVTAISELEQEKVYLTSATTQQISSPLEFYGNITYKSNTTLDTFTFENGTTLDLSAMGVGAFKLPGTSAEGRLDHDFIKINGDTQVMGVKVDRAHVATIADKTSVAVRWSEDRAEAVPSRGWQLVGLNDSSVSNTADIVTFYNAKDLISNNSEAGISVSWDATNQNFDFNVNDPTITFAGGDVTGSFTITNLGSVNNIALTIQPNSVALGTDTTGKYVTDIIGTANEIAIEATTPSPHNDDGAQYQIGLPSNVTVSNNLTVSNDLTVTGNLTVNGTQTILNTATLEVEDTLVLTGSELTVEPTDGGFGLEVGPITSPTGVASNVTGAHSIVYNYATDRWEADGSLILSEATLGVPTVEGFELSSSRNLDFNVGAGLSTSAAVNGNDIDITYTNTDRGSSQAIFKNVSAGGVTVSAEINNDTLALTDDSVVKVLGVTDGPSDEIQITHADVLTDALGTAGEYGQTGAQDGKYIKSLTLTAEGHVSAITTADFDTRYQATNPSFAITAQGNAVDNIFPSDTIDFRVDTTDGVAGLTVVGGGTATIPNIRFAHGNTSTLSGSYGQTGTEDGTYVKSVTVDALGHLSGVSTDSFDNRYMQEWFLRDGDGDTLEINQGKYVQMLEGTGIDINFTDTTPGSSADPFDITITNTDRGSSQNIFKNVQIQNSAAGIIATNSADSNNDTLILREVQVASTNGITLSTIADDIIGIAHADTSSQASVNNAARTYIQDITLDAYGHITGIVSGTETYTYTHPPYTPLSENETTTGAEVFSNINIASDAIGSLTTLNVTKRTLTLGNLGFTGWDLYTEGTKRADIGNNGQVNLADDGFLTTAYTAGSGATTNTVSYGHPTSGVTANTYGNSTTIPQITVDSRGHITGVTALAIPTYDNYSSWTLTADSGTNQVINSGNTVDVAGGTTISTVVSATDTVTINHENVSKTTTTPTSSVDITTANFNAVSSITVNAQGHVTDIVTTSYDLDATIGIGTDSGNFTTNLDGANPDFGILGTTNEIETSFSGTNVIVGLPSAVTISGALTTPQVNLTSADALSFEDGKHWITTNDGQGNFNIRVGHYSNSSTEEEVTEDGYAAHWEFAQNTGVWDLQVSESSLVAGNTLSGASPTASWISALRIGPSAVGITPDVTMDNDLVVTGNLTVNGTTTTVNTETVTIQDNIILLNSNAAATPTEDAGIEVERGNSTNAQLIWDESADRWVVAGAVSGTLAYTSEIPTVGNGQLSVSGGTYITGSTTFTANQSGNSTVTLNHDDTARSDTVTAASPAHGGSFTVVDSVTTNDQGHLSAINVKTVTLPSDNNTDTLQSIANGTVDQNEYISFVGNATGAQSGFSDTNLRWNPSTDLLTIGGTSGIYFSGLGEGLEIKDGGASRVTASGQTPNDLRIINLRDANPATDGGLMITADASAAGDAATELVFINTSVFEWKGDGVVVDTRSVSAGTGLTGGGDLSANRTISVDYAGTNNFIDSATNLEGTAIATNDTIVYHDATDNNVKKGFVSNLPFTNNTGTVTSIDVNGGTNITVSEAGPVTSSGTFTVNFDGSGEVEFSNTATNNAIAVTAGGYVNILSGTGYGFDNRLYGDVTSNDVIFELFGNAFEIQDSADANKFVRLAKTGNITLSGTVDGRDVAADGTKLDGIDAGANNYSLPTAAANTLGGIEVGFTTNAGARNYAVQLSGNDAYVNVPWSDTNTDTNTTYAISVVDDTPAAGDATLRLTAGGSGSGTQDIEFGGNSNITFNSPSAGVIEALIASNAVGNAKLADMGANTIKGAVTAGSPVDLTPTQVRTMINVENGATADQTQADINALAITQVGTITSGTWQGSAISTAYISNLSGTNTGDEPDASASVAGIVTTGTQTFAGEKTFNGGAKLPDSANLTLGTGNDYLIDFTGAHLIIHQNVSTTNDIEITSTTDTTQFLFDVSAGSFHAEGDIVAFSTATTSDIALKDNVQVVEGALDKVAQLNGVTFTWKKDGTASAGVIAQNVEEVLPSAVKEIDHMNKGEEFYKHVDYNQLSALFIEAIKELKQENAELRAMIEELKK